MAEKDKPPLPPALDWRTAYEMMERHGVEHTTVVALSMISEQLDYLIRGKNDG